ncbi:hypothetical protein [Streptomyces sp. NPDC005435]|uniref:hypothetical protein n=1 Tax=Streptomyces sp. NPDC005435 TaxID=3154464 RepID=UPI003453DF79
MSQPEPPVTSGTAEPPKKPRDQVIADNLWGSPAVFVCLAFLSFYVFRSASGDRIGWTLYFCGWLPAVAMGAWSAVKRRSPGVGGVFALVLLTASGGVFWLNHG